jgi:hypothetical protein
MLISEISDFDLDWEELKADNQITHWNGRQIEWEQGIDDRTSFAQVILKSFDPMSSTQLKPLGNIGGSTSAEKNDEGNTEVKAEVHVSTKSEDGNTTVTAKGEATVDNKGNYTGKVEVSFEHEF